MSILNWIKIFDMYEELTSLKCLLELIMANNKISLVTVVTGQDGACIDEFLLDKGCEVHGIKRRSSSFNTDRTDHLKCLS